MTVQLHSKESKQPRILKLPDRIEFQTTASFFAISNPGMEKLVRHEIEEILHGEQIVEVIGGLQFQASIGAVQTAQPRLKTVNRILLRVDQFGVRDFQKLFRKVKGLPWNNWLKSGVFLKVRASSHRSRLKIKKGIEQTVVDAFSEAVSKQKSPQKEPLDKELLALVRIDDDICTLSLDLSGELLHKRGDREDVGIAPLRETWAAGVLNRSWQLIEQTESLQSAFSRPWDWIEPMAGTAVFAREALKSHQVSLAPTRLFAINECLKIEGSLPAAPTGPEDSPAINSSPLRFLEKLIVLDQNEKRLQAAKSSIEGILEALQNDRHFQEKIPQLEFHHLDFSSYQTDPTCERARFVVLNPPWGIRLKSMNAASSFERQSQLLSDINTILKPTFVAILLPELKIKSRIEKVRFEGRPADSQGGQGDQGDQGDQGEIHALKLPRGWTEHEGFSFRAGGIPVMARFFSVDTLSSR